MFASRGTGHAFRRSSSITGPGNRTVTDEATTRTPGGYTRSATTGPDQRAVNRASKGPLNPATTTWPNMTTYTGPRNNAADVNRSTTFSK